MQKNTCNIYDVAKMAGVSTATVSRVLNGSDKVSPRTRDKVMVVVTKVGFTPNAFAKGLGMNTMHTVGILVPTISDTYMASAVAYLEKELVTYGYDCILSCSGFELAGKQTKTEMLLSKHIDSLIYVGSTYAGNGKDIHATDYIRRAAKQVPVFIINGNVAGENIYASVFEDEAAVYEMTGRLIGRGRKHILFLTDSHSYSSNNKKKGFRKALKEAGIDEKDKVLYVENDVYAVKEYLLSLEGKKIDAIIAANDDIAIGAVKYALHRGIRIPEDLEIIGYNNSYLAVSSSPEISSIDNHTAEICKDTVERIIRILSGEENTLKHKISVPCSLVERETTLRESAESAKL